MHVLKLHVKINYIVINAREIRKVFIDLQHFLEVKLFVFNLAKCKNKLLFVFKQLLFIGEKSRVKITLLTDITLTLFFVNIYNFLIIRHTYLGVSYL